MAEDIPFSLMTLGNINFLEHITKKILEINENYNLYTLPGVCENDILLAYIYTVEEFNPLRG